MNSSFMPWGSHRGEPIEELPAKYIKWLIKADCFNGLSRSSQQSVRDRYAKIMKDEQQASNT